MNHGRLPDEWVAGLRLPLVVAPMFLVTSIDLVAEACLNGAIGAIPSLNARSPEILDEWLGALTRRLASAARPVAPWAVNLVAHPTNKRLQPDLELCVRYRAPLVITALGGPRPVIDAVHAYGGLVFADVNSPEYARKAAKAGVDGLVLVASGAGGHTGQASMFAFLQAVREFWDGIVVAGGALNSGADIRAVQAIGADLASMGTRFIATRESSASDAYKQMVVDSRYEDILCTNAITGAWANKLRPSLVAAGLDPDNLKPRGRFDASNQAEDAKAWRDLWSAGHGVGHVKAIQTAAGVISQIASEYDQALARELADPWRTIRATVGGAA